MLVNKERLWEFVDKRGETVTICQYDEVKDYSEGFAAVKKDDKWAYIDSENTVVMDYYLYCAAGAFRMNVGEFMME